MDRGFFRYLEARMDKTICCSTKKYHFFKGRVALYAILKAIGVKPGDEIIIPGFTCIVVPNAITYLGGKPVYVDINPNTFNIDVSKLEEALAAKNSLTRPKAIIAQHTFGIPAEMDKVVDIARRYNLYAIEDSCHAIGSKYNGKEVGIFGDAAFFSSQWSKPLTTGLGGWAIVNNEKLRESMKDIYPDFIEPSFKEKALLGLQYLIYAKLFKPSLFWIAQNSYRTLSRMGVMIGSSSDEELESKMPEGYKKKMSQWQRNLLEMKVGQIDQMIDHRRWVTSLYEKQLKEVGLKTINLPEKHEPVFLRYPLLIRDKERTLREARQKRLEIGDWFVSPVHPNLYGWDKVGYRSGMCPVAEDICRHVINLPTHRGINEEEASKIAEFVVNSR
jgi:perosamine synthetase